MSAIFTALSKFHEEVGKIKKSSTNPHFKNKYADVNTVLDAIREPLKKAGLCFVQLPQQGGLKTILATTEGDEQIESFLEYELSKKDMQGLGSAITYARRYALVSMLGLEAEDDDGNEASKPREIKSLNSRENVLEIESLISQSGTDRTKFLQYFKVDSIEQLPYDKAIQALQAKLAKAS